MNEHERLLVVLKRQSEKLIEAGPEACIQHLIKIGVLNKDGSQKEYDHKEFLGSNHPLAFQELGIVGKVHGPIV